MRNLSIRFATVLLLFISAGVGARAFAADVDAAEFRAAALIIPTTLVNRYGESRFDSFDLEQLIEQMNSQIEVEMTDQPWSVADLNGNGRETARWSIRGGRRKITVSRKFWKSIRAQKPYMALHEFFGVLGYDDSAYQLSTHLWLLSRSSSQAILNEEEKELLRHRIGRMGRTKLAMGTNSSGGGGSESLYARETVLNHKIDLLRQSSSQRERETNFESVLSTLDSRFEVQTFRKEPLRDHLYQENLPLKRSTLCLLVPGARITTCKLSPRAAYAGNSCRCPEDPNSSGTVMFVEEN